MSTESKIFQNLKNKNEIKIKINDKIISVLDVRKETSNKTVLSKKANGFVKINQGKQNKNVLNLMFHQTAGNKQPYTENILLCKSHFLIPGSGEIFYLHDVYDKVAGTPHGFVSVEVAGRFPANIKEGKFKKLSEAFDKKHTDVLSQYQKDSIKDVISCFLEFTFKTKEIKRVCFHCNTYKMRTFCCGQEIAKLAKDEAVKQGMFFDPNWSVDSGVPTHKEWL